MSSRDFYKNLPAFENFLAIEDKKSFTPVPDDWWVVLTDIKNSTVAAKSGQFKQVNILGAASITVISNTLPDFDLPFVFGGDGATMMIHQSDRPKVELELSRLIRMASVTFNLELRVGLVNVGLLHAKGFEVALGKYQMTATTQLAQFRGSGIAQAEQMVKGREADTVLLSGSKETTFPNMDGLSCRLQPFNNRRGLIMSIIVRPSHSEDSDWIRQVLLRQMAAILDGNLSLANPVSEQQLRWRWLPQTWRTELRLFGDRGMAIKLKKLLMLVLANASLKLDFRLGPFIPRKYKSEVAPQSDFKKFDDCLRMVIDCSPGQRDQIAKLLIGAHREGKIFYGIFESKSAIATCLTISASTGRHLHFVDGEGCGYTQAAVQMKAQMKVAPPLHKNA